MGGGGCPRFTKAPAPGDLTTRTAPITSFTYLENKILIFIFMEVIPAMVGIIIFGICVFAISLGVWLLWKDFYTFKVRPRLAKRKPGDNKSEGETTTMNLSTRRSSIQSTKTPSTKKSKTPTPGGTGGGSAKLHRSHSGMSIAEGLYSREQPAATAIPLNPKPSVVRYPSLDGLHRQSIITITFPRYDDKEEDTAKLLRSPSIAIHSKTQADKSAPPVTSSKVPAAAVPQQPQPVLPGGTTVPVPAAKKRN